MSWSDRSVFESQNKGRRLLSCLNVKGQVALRDVLSSSGCASSVTFASCRMSIRRHAAVSIITSGDDCAAQ